MVIENYFYEVYGYEVLIPLVYTYFEGHGYHTWFLLLFVIEYFLQFL